MWTSRPRPVLQAGRADLADTPVPGKSLFSPGPYRSKLQSWWDNGAYSCVAFYDGVSWSGPWKIETRVKRVLLRPHEMYFLDLISPKWTPRSGFRFGRREGLKSAGIISSKRNHISILILQCLIRTFCKYAAGFLSGSQRHAATDRWRQEGLPSWYSSNSRQLSCQIFPGTHLLDTLVESHPVWVIIR